MAMMLTVLMIALALAVQVEEYRPVDVTESKELAARVRSWSAAIRRGDFERASEFTWEEYRHEVARQMKTPGSELYRLFAAPNAPMRRVAAGSDALVRIFRPVSGEIAGVRTYGVCVAPSFDDRMRLPSRFVDLISTRRSDLFCTYWVHEREGIFVSYAFAIPE